MTAPEVLWPAVAVLGFLAMAGVVVVLGRASTARYEFERNAVRARQQAPVPADAGTPAGGEPARARADVPVPAAAAATSAAASPARTAVGLAPHPAPAAAPSPAPTHPAGRRTADAGAPAGWYLVDGEGDLSAPAALAGPFGDRVEAEWVALACGVEEDARAVHGTLREDGTVARRPSPEDRAWLAQLGEQLDRLADDWDDLLTDEDALTTLAVEVTAALVEAGLPLHDCGGTAEAPVGGVCLTPEPLHGGILVSWRQHDRMSVQQVRGAALDTAVQRTMNDTLATLLVQFGFVVEQFGEETGAAGCSLVTAIRTHPSAR